MKPTTHFRLLGGLILLTTGLILALPSATAAEGQLKPDATWTAGRPLQLAAAMVYHGNRKSKVFHRPGCRYYNCQNCVVVFKSKVEAIKAGFRPCKVCRP